MLSEEAYERLKTIGEFTDLGFGFKIAMRDLEIRGAGNLLGAEQSGHIAAVGLRPLLPDGHRGGRRAEGRAGRRAASRSRSTCPSTPTCRATTSRATTCAWRRTGGSPRSPIPSTSTTSAPSGTTATGRRPPPAVALLDVARLRAECVRLGIRSIIVQRNIARITGLELRESQKVRLRRLAPKAVAKDDSEIVIPLSVKPADVAPMLVALLDELVPPRGDPAVGSARASLRNAMSRSTLAAILAVVISVVGTVVVDRRLQRHRRVARGGAGQRRQGVAGRR